MWYNAEVWRSNAWTHRREGGNSSLNWSISIRKPTFIMLCGAYFCIEGQVDFKDWAEPYLSQIVKNSQAIISSSYLNLWALLSMSWHSRTICTVYLPNSVFWFISDWICCILFLCSDSFALMTLSWLETDLSASLISSPFRSRFLPKDTENFLLF